jgi:hypothetical protein
LYGDPPVCPRCVSFCGTLDGSGSRNICESGDRGLLKSSCICCQCSFAPRKAPSRPGFDFAVVIISDAKSSCTT